MIFSLQDCFEIAQKDLLRLSSIFDISVELVLPTDTVMWCYDLSVGEYSDFIRSYLKAELGIKKQVDSLTNRVDFKLSVRHREGALQFVIYHTIK